MVRPRLPSLAPVRLRTDEDWYRRRFDELNDGRYFIRRLEAAESCVPARYALLSGAAPVEFTPDLGEALDQYVRVRNSTSVFDLGLPGDPVTVAGHVPLDFRVDLPTSPRRRVRPEILRERAAAVLGPARAVGVERFLLVDGSFGGMPRIEFEASIAAAREHLEDLAAVLDDSVTLYDLAAPEGPRRLPLRLTVTTKRGYHPACARVFDFG